MRPLLSTVSVAMQGLASKRLGLQRWGFPFRSSSTLSSGPGLRPPPGLHGQAPPVFRVRPVIKPADCLCDAVSVGIHMPKTLAGLPQGLHLLHGGRCLSVHAVSTHLNLRFWLSCLSYLPNTTGRLDGRLCEGGPAQVCRSVRWHSIQAVGTLGQGGDCAGAHPVGHRHASSIRGFSLLRSHYTAHLALGHASPSAPTQFSATRLHSAAASCFFYWPCMHTPDSSALRLRRRAVIQWEEGSPSQVGRLLGVTAGAWQQVTTWVQHRGTAWILQELTFEHVAGCISPPWRLVPTHHPDATCLVGAHCQEAQECSSQLAPGGHRSLAHCAGDTRVCGACSACD